MATADAKELIQDPADTQAGCNNPAVQEDVYWPGVQKIVRAATGGSQPWTNQPLPRRNAPDHKYEFAESSDTPCRFHCEFRDVAQQ